MPRRLPGLLLVLALATACGSGGDDPGPDPTAATSTSTSSTTSTTIPPFPAAAGECGLRGSYRPPWPGRPSYRARLDVDPTAGVVHGRLAARFAPPEGTDRLVWRLWGNIPRVVEGGGGVEVTAARVDGERVEGTYEVGRTAYVLQRPGGFPSGVPVDVRLSFRLDLPGAVNERIARTGDSVRLGSVLPMLSWIRGFGWHTAPAVRAFSEAVGSEVADYDVTVKVPSGFTVLATGEEVVPGRFFAQAVRDWAATVGRLDVAEVTAQQGALRVVVGSAQGSGDDPAARARDVAGAVDDFARRYGPLPWKVLSVGITPSLSGGIEFPQHFHLGANTSRDHLVHEVAHMWFYALVGNDQHEEPWLDEGLAEYAESRRLGNTSRPAAPAGGAGRLGESHDYWASRTSIFYRSVYLQGMAALAAYAEQVEGGLDGVDCGLRRYVLEHAHRVARPGDLLEALHEQTGVDPRPVFARFGAP